MSVSPGRQENVLLAALHLEDDARRRQMYNFLLHRGANYWDIDNETGPSARLTHLVGAILHYFSSINMLIFVKHVIYM